MASQTAHTFHDISPESVASTLQTDIERGLSGAEAERRLERYGPNELSEQERPSLWLIFFRQFVSPIIWILMVAGGLAFAFNETLEGIAVAIVILINSLIGFFMEWQAQVSMRQLQAMSHTQARVIRGGAAMVIDASTLVPGDLLYLEAGDMVTADARVVVSNSLAVKEAALTGESVQISKQIQPLPEDTQVADRNNSLFKGTVVTGGNARALVTATGDATVLGNISSLAQAAEKSATPLDQRLETLSKKLIWLTLGLTVLILPIGYFQGQALWLMIETAVALAVAAIPEGLPVIATITLARGMIRLARQQVIVKSLEAVQTLGETNVIFTDKTGTLTENHMAAQQIRFSDQQLDAQPGKRAPSGTHPNLPLLLETAVLCNNAQHQPQNHDQDAGDPIELALLRWAHAWQVDADSLRQAYPREGELPFDANTKWMATLHRKGASHWVFVKGATQAVLPHCTHFLESGQKAETPDPFFWEKEDEALSASGLRVLSFAYKEVAQRPEADTWVSDLTFLGLIAFVDPVRDDIKPAIRTCREAGIEVIMITGDHPETAVHIARQAGLLLDDEPATAMHGKELALLSQEPGQQEKILNTRVFARVDPAQKLDLVSLYQQNNYIAGMTGDGVNDAPALKKADIGIAMGLRGTEAAKEVADLILKDDAFTSIVSAIRQGRVIFDNIRSFVVYLLSCNLSEILVVTIATLLQFPMPLLPLQILFLNLVTDVFPALALGLDEGEADIMKKAPRNPQEAIINRRHWWAIFGYGAMLTLAVLGVESYGLYVRHLPAELVNNLTFYTLIFAQLWHVFNLPGSGVSFFRNAVTRNPFIWMAIALCIGLLLMAYFIPPLAEALSLIAFPPRLILDVLAFSLLPVVLVQIMKRVFKIIR